MSNEIKNRVKNSNIIQINLEDFSTNGNRLLFDIKDWLYEETILVEKEFRIKLNEHNWSKYTDSYVALTCSNDAIVPSWAYMLLASKLQEYVKMVIFGNLHELENILLLNKMSTIDLEKFKDEKVIIKGCGNMENSNFSFVEITRRLKPYVKSIMYGEPCSSVPIYKKK